jgi:hypothetical protein
MTQQPRPVPTSHSPEHLALVVDIWKHGVGVQMHFNDMGMKIRTLYFTILAAAMGLIGVVQGKIVIIEYPLIHIHLVLFVLLAIIPISMLFYFLDAHWYHRLLLGAVEHCGNIEKNYKDELPEIQLGTLISAKSPVKFEGVWRWIFWFIKDERFRDPKISNIHSDAKIEVLYKTVIWTMVVLVVLYLVFGAIEFGHCSAAAWVMDASCATQSPNIWHPVIR